MLHLVWLFRIVDNLSSNVDPLELAAYRQMRFAWDDAGHVARPPAECEPLRSISASTSRHPFGQGERPEHVVQPGELSNLIYL